MASILIASYRNRTGAPETFHDISIQSILCDGEWVTMIMLAKTCKALLLPPKASHPTGRVISSHKGKQRE